MHKQLRQNRGRLPVSAPSPHPHYAKQTQSPYRWRLAGIPSLHCAKQTQFAVPPASCQLRTPPFPRNEPNLPCPQHPAGFAPHLLRKTNPISRLSSLSLCEANPIPVRARSRRAGMPPLCKTNPISSPRHPDTARTCQKTKRDFTPLRSCVFPSRLLR